MTGGTEPDAGLRAIGLRNGILLSSREGVGLAVRLIGVLVLTRLIGPGEYGAYAGSVAIVFVVTALAQMSAEMFLVRETDDLSDERCHEVFTFLLAATLPVTVVGLAVTVAVERNFDVPVDAMQVLLLSVPASALWAPAQAQLERSFRFGKLAALELSGDVVLYAVALPLAILGFGAVGAAVGYLAWQTYLLVGSALMARYRPRLRWSMATNRRVVRFGFGITMAQWLTRARDLVNPLVVGPLAGAAAVGMVALAIRLVETLVTVVRSGARLLYAGLARVQRDRDRFGRMLSEAMGLQSLALGLLVGGFSMVAPDAIRIVFGDTWAPVIDIVPWFALAALAAGIPNALVQALVVRERTFLVGSVELVRILVLIALAVPLVREWGAGGFGVASVIALVPAVALVRAVRDVATIRWSPSLMWIVAFAPTVAAPLLEWPSRLLLIVPGLVTMATPPGRTRLRSIASQVTASLRSEPSTSRPAPATAANQGGDHAR